MRTLHFAARQLARNPIFGVVVVLSLAVGIGANTALFSLVDAMVLRKLPVADPDELVYLEWSFTGELEVSVNGSVSRDPRTNALTSTSFALDTFEALRASSRTLRDVFAFAPTYRSTVNIDGQVETLPSQLVSGNYFAALGVQARVGRTITDADDAEANPVAVISDRYWQRRFARDPGVVGKTISLNGKPLTLIGVLPPRFLGAQDFGQLADISYPLSLEAELKQLTPAMRSPTGWWLRIMGRLASDVTREQALGELQPLFAATMLAAQAPPTLSVSPGARGLADGFREPSRYLLPLAAISVALLAIVCLNIANLMMARTTARRREIAMRFALGAGRLRLLGQLLTEALLLACIGGALGVLLAYWSKDLLLLLLPQGGFRFYELAIDERVLAFAVAASMVAGLLFAILPALHATRRDTAVIGDSVRGRAAQRSVVARTLLATQVALSVALLVGAGLLVESVRNLQAVDVGFRTDGLLVFDASPGDQRYDAARTNAFYERLLERIEAVPGIQGVTLATYALVGQSGAYRGVAVEGIDAQSVARVGIQRVRHNFFTTIGIPLLDGRAFDDSDRLDSPKVAVINEALARAIPGGALGRRLFFDFGRPDLDQRIEIVGVVKDVSARPSRSDVVPVVYLSAAQEFVGGQAMSSATLMARTATDPSALAAAIREVGREVDANVPLVDFRSQNEQIARGFSTEQMLARAASAFGAVAMLLASIGLFGLLMYGVQQRTREIGVRMALGARSGNVVALVMRQTFALIGVGVIAGVAGALALGPALERSTVPLLFDVAPYDPTIIGAAVALMLVVATAAAYLPARSASRVDPTVTLRHD